MKKNQLILTILIITSVFQGLNAQSAKLDSMQNLLDKHPQADTVRVNLLNEIAYSSQGSEPEKSLNYAEEALELANKLNFKKGISVSYINIGIVYKDQGNYPLALEYYFKSLKIKEELGDKKGIAMSYNNIGSI